MRSEAFTGGPYRAEGAREPSYPEQGQRERIRGGLYSALIEPVVSLDRPYLILLIIIITSSFLVRFFDITEQGLVVDEAEKFYSVQEMKDGRFWVDLEHPPVEKYLILISTTLFGDDEWAIKLPNALLGSLTPLLVFILLARLWRSPWPGLIGAVMTALTPPLIGYSLIAKEDTPLNFFALLFLIMVLPSVTGRAPGADPADMDGKKGVRGEGQVPLHLFSPLKLNSLEVASGIVMGLALATKYTFVFYCIAWAVPVMIWRRDWLRTRGLPMLTVGMITFIVLSWYYLNPYWLILGLGHWLWEAGTGHATYFLGSTYNYPPPWFYPVVIFGRLSPFLYLGSFGLISVLLCRSPELEKEGSDAKGLNGAPSRSARAVSVRRKGRYGRATGSGKEAAPKERVTPICRLRSTIEKDPTLWIIASWLLVGLLIMTLLPFKGVRYIQWIILPMVLLSSSFVWWVFKRFRGSYAGPLSLGITLLLVIPVFTQGYPDHSGGSLFLGKDSGVRDHNGQGFKEALEWLERNGNGGRLSIRWEKLGRYYYGNVTGPVSSLEEAREKEVVYVLLYIYDLQRKLESGMTGLAMSDEMELMRSFSRDGVTVIWIYGMVPDN